MLMSHRRIVEASRETGRQIRGVFRRREGVLTMYYAGNTSSLLHVAGITHQWDQRTPRQVFRQQRGRAGIWDHYVEDDGRFTEPTDTTVGVEELE